MKRTRLQYLREVTAMDLHLPTFLKGTTTIITDILSRAEDTEEMDPILTLSPLTIAEAIQATIIIIIATKGNTPLLEATTIPLPSPQATIIISKDKEVRIMQWLQPFHPFFIPFGGITGTL
jgi:hypothetical protein